jgi:hypothetical protein
MDRNQILHQQRNQSVSGQKLTPLASNPIGSTQYQRTRLRAKHTDEDDDFCTNVQLTLSGLIEPVLSIQWWLQGIVAAFSKVQEGHELGLVVNAIQTPFGWMGLLIGRCDRVECHHHILLCRCCCFVRAW